MITTQSPHFCSQHCQYLWSPLPLSRGEQPSDCPWPLFTHHWPDQAVEVLPRALLSRTAGPLSNVGKNHVYNVEVLISYATFQRLRLCKSIFIFYKIIKFHCVDSDHSSVIKACDVEHAKWRVYRAVRSDGQVQGPVLLLRYDAVPRILANGSAASIESCAAIGWNSCDSVRSL